MDTLFRDSSSIRTNVASKVLVVDDDEGMRRSVCAILEQYGFEHQEAADGLSALELVKRWQPDILLLDVIMPHLDGIAVCRALRETPGTRTLPIITMTGATDKTLQLQCLEAGANDFIAKPIDVAELLARIRNLLRFRLVANGKEEWEKTIDCIRDMVMLIDGAGNIRRCNKSTTVFLQRSYLDVIGNNWLALLKTKGIGVDTATDRVMEVRQEQTDRLFEVRLFPIEQEGSLSSTSATIRDITEQRELEEALRLDEDRFKALWDLGRMPDATVMELVDFALESAVRLTQSSGGYFHFMNEDQQSMNLYAWSREVIKTCKAEKTPHYPVERAGIWADCVRLRKPVIHNDYPNEPGRKGLPEGHFALHRHLSIPVFEGDTIVAVAGVGNKSRPYRDVDVNQLFLFMNDLWILLKQKKQKDALHQQNAELEKAYGDLKTVKAHAFQQEKLASIGQIAAGVAHEINNPIGFIMSNLGTLQKYVGKMKEYIGLQRDALTTLSAALASSGEQAGQTSDAVMNELETRNKTLKIEHVTDDLMSLVQESLDGAERIKKIMLDLKGFSRGDEKELRPADINAGLDSTINIVWNELKYKATLKKEYGELPLTECNIGQLNQVFMNLLVNAAHAIEKSGEIRVTTWTEKGSIHVAVADTGSGISPENLNRIFEPFFTTKDVGKGTGLGLSIAFEIVKKHDGDITVESAVGKGTTFTVRIPIRG
jgi:signal transduction histidine kinase/CheY-like chemotaxis protein